MASPAELRKYRELLTAIILEFQTNQTTLNELLNWYGVFLFTGGAVPRGQWDLVAITRYLERPFATHGISIGDVEHYGHLVKAIMEPGQGIAAGPRTLRCRHDMAATFSQASSQIRTLGSTLEAAFARALREQE